MGIGRVKPGTHLPDEFNVIVEIPFGAGPIKYEVDKESGALFVDRFLGTSMNYPCNYGYIPETIAADGDPVDVCLITPYPLTPGVVITCRPLGVLVMEDEHGGDVKILAVPIVHVCNRYAKWQNYEDVPESLRNATKHFFEHYKDLEQGKWVRVGGWEGPDMARRLITEGRENYLKSAAE